MTPTIRRGITALALVVCSSISVSQTAPKEFVELDADRKPAIETHGDCFIKGGTIFTVTNGVIQNASILVRNGKIAAIGKDLVAPPGMTVVDAVGKFITPGIVDAHSHMAADSINEGADSITAEVRIRDVLDTQSLSMYQKLASGFTSALVLHGSANPIGGQSVVIKLKWKHPVEEVVVPDAPRMIKFALGENVTRAGRPGQGPARYPTTRMGVETVYRRAFTEARKYMAEWERYEKSRAVVADVSGGSRPAATPPRRDLRLEALADVLRRKIWVHCHSYRSDEMLMMLRLSKEFGFKLSALQHALEAYKIAPEIAAAGVGVSTFSDSWAYKVEAFDSIPYNAAMCMRAGILTSVNTDTGGGLTPLNLEAAKTMKYGGLTENEALRLITINAAAQLGIDKRTGSLDTGKDADITIWDGHPFSVYSRCWLTMVEGVTYFQRRDAFGLNSQSVVRNEISPCTADHPNLPTPAPAAVYVIAGGTVHPMDGPDIINGSVVVESGRITAVGSKVRTPKGAVIVHANGMHVYPGLINAGTQIGMAEIGSVRETNDSAEAGSFQPDLVALTAVNASSEHFAVTRGNGVTTALTAPSGSGLITGQSSVINLAGWTPDEMKVRGAFALHVNFPESAGGGGRGRGPQPTETVTQENTRQQKQVRDLREYFEKAKRYAGSHAGSTDGADVSLDAMMPYATGKAPVVFNVNTAAGIKKALVFADELGLKPIVAGGRESWRVAELLSKKGVPVLLTLPDIDAPGSVGNAREYDPYDTTLATAALLNRAGVRFAFQTTGASMAKDLTTRAGAACAFGLPRDAAMKAMTTGAAEILGVGDKLGSLSLGKVANLIITDGDPLEVTTSVHAIFINGAPIPLESRHTRLYKQFKARLSSSGQ